MNPKPPELVYAYIDALEKHNRELCAILARIIHLHEQQYLQTSQDGHDRAEHALAKARRLLLFLPPPPDPAQP
jgi:hypothetical protein